MVDQVDIVIVGAGPAGLSAAARAAENSIDNKSAPSYILLEGFVSPAKTIFNFQKSKPVMDEPGYLDLRSAINFKAGSREHVLAEWQKGLDEHQANVRYNTNVTSISRQNGCFKVDAENGYSVEAKKVVLAIGLQGNPRRLGVANDIEPYVQYSLSDPDEYKNETIVVVGAGDAAIENAVALARNNKVYIINRRDEFSRAKEGNLSAILQAINSKATNLSCFYSSSIKELKLNSSNDSVKGLTLATLEGEVEIAVDRVIARLGANPPRKLIESFGVEFPSSLPSALPELSDKYESNVPGLFIVGALAGYPLIKQAMNQGYDVIEHLSGKSVEPVDYSLLKLQFSQLPYMQGVDETLAMLRERTPMFRQINKLALKDMVIESRVHVVLERESYTAALENLEAIKKQLLQEVEAGTRRKMPRLPTLWQAGSTIYSSGEYSSSFYTIVDGAVDVDYDELSGSARQLEMGEFFGEHGLLSGSARGETVRAVTESILIETPRRVMLKLMNSFEPVKTGIDWVFTARALAAKFAPNLPIRELYNIVSDTQIVSISAGEKLFVQGQQGDVFYYIRSGNIVLSREESGAEIFVGQAKTGQIVGDMVMMGDASRKETATASLRTELVEIRREQYYSLCGNKAADLSGYRQSVSETLKSRAKFSAQSYNGDLIAFLMDQGLGEATNAFILSEDLCVGCNNCESACAATHGGVSRLQRAKGDSFQKIHVPITCRHCELPHCMKDCPPNALHRSVSGEVFVDDSCIGCGNCVTNCPYGAIELKAMPEEKFNLFSWLFFGKGSELGTSTQSSGGLKKAVKCDACVDRPAGPACVAACPTGAASRLNPLEFIDRLEH